MTMLNMRQIRYYRNIWRIWNSGIPDSNLLI